MTIPSVVGGVKYKKREIEIERQSFHIVASFDTLQSLNAIITFL